MVKKKDSPKGMSITTKTVNTIRPAKKTVKARTFIY